MSKKNLFKQTLLISISYVFVISVVVAALASVGSPIQGFAVANSSQGNSSEMSSSMSSMSNSMMSSVSSTNSSSTSNTTSMSSMSDSSMSSSSPMNMSSSMSSSMSNSMDSSMMSSSASDVSSSPSSAPYVYSSSSISSKGSMSSASSMNSSKATSVPPLISITGAANSYIVNSIMINQGTINYRLDNSFNTLGSGLTLGTNPIVIHFFLGE